MRKSRLRGLQNSHHLQPFERLALEGNPHGLQVPPQKRCIDRGSYFYITSFERIAQSNQLLGNDGQKLHPLPGVVAVVGLSGDGRHGPQQIVRQLPPLGCRSEKRLQQRRLSQLVGGHPDTAVGEHRPAQLLDRLRRTPRNIGMREDTRRIDMIERRPLPPFAPVRLQLDEPFQKGVGKGRLDRVSHRHVDAAGLLRQRMEQRQQQVFVGQHDGRLLVQRPFPAVGTGAQRIEYPAGIFALHGVRRRGYDRQLLLFSKIIMRQLDHRWKRRMVFTHEHSRLLVGVFQIVVVVIPIEIGFGVVLQKTEQHLLAGRKSIESRHDIAPPLGESEIARQQPLGRGALHHTSVGDPLTLQPCAETVVDVAQRPPHSQETAFLLRKRRSVGEIGPELADHLQLFGGQVGDVGLQLLQLVDIAEQRIGVDTVLVDRVEVVEQHLAPEIELVERFVVAGRIDLVQLGDQSDAFARMQSRNLLHQVVDRQPTGLPHRPFGQMRKGVDEEMAGTTGREENVQRRNILSVAPVEIGCDLLQKTLHRPLAPISDRYLTARTYRSAWRRCANVRSTDCPHSGSQRPW